MRKLASFGRRFKKFFKKIGSDIIDFLGKAVKILGEITLFGFTAISRMIGFIIKILGKILLSLWKLSKILWSKFDKNILRKPDKLAALIFLLFALGILGSIFYPYGEYIFEGNFLVEELSFIVNSSDNQRLITPISGLKTFDLTGQQTLTLRGKFTSKTEPKFNQKSEITLNLDRPNSRLLISSVNENQPSDIELTQLQLIPFKTEKNQNILPVKVQSLKYDSQVNQLSFCLKLVPNTPDDLKYILKNDAYNNKKPSDSFNQGKLSIDICQDPDVSITNQPLANLGLKLGENPINISLEQVSIPELGIKSSPDNPNFIDFTLIPESDQRELTLNSPSRLTINLPPPENFSRWIQGNLDVKQVKFTQSETMGDNKDQFPSSTIVSGEILMTDKSLEIQQNQFFLISGQPGIERLRSIEIQPESPSGLQVRFVGKTNQVEVGIDPQFPVRKIKPLWISSLGFSSDSIIALLSFCATIIGFLLPYLFISASSSNSDIRGNGE
ncbi:MULTISPECIES: hypothetical protein [Planktothrix]|uniref:Uncharacterized protein n=1 Tax=Planktothrix rubescens CCAP 1459/22 TaxID=329571 RepID=A0A6J7ZN26_PLARU|nr:MULTISPECIES: hypothetical protein [Planktothrix]CAC5343882.1 conserved membrane hypothetical protein [Planktothrix rubescens NIVA-CYA 18]CAD5981659.1 hypothetical protein PCC7821_04804 [Planktothrix rubescens NIVA-CYA 18]CAH2575343.1 hypothetical protein PRNO82_04709 [Planktothrix rubescens]